MKHLHEYATRNILHDETPMYQVRYEMWSMKVRAKCPSIETMNHHQEPLGALYQELGAPHIVMPVGSYTKAAHP